MMVMVRIRKVTIINNSECIFDPSNITKDKPTNTTLMYFKNDKTEKYRSKLSSNILDLNIITNKKNEMIQTKTSTNNNNFSFIPDNINTLECIFDPSHITTFQKNNKTKKYISKLSSNILYLNSITNENIAMIQTNKSINNNNISIIYY